MYKVVIFEDDAFLLDAYQLKLSSEANFKSVAFADGEDALDRIKAEKPDIIILDIIMPKRSGLEVLKELKHDEETKHIPVIVASNVGQKVTVEEAIAMGAVDYFVKSDATITDLIEKCKKYLKEK